jgi:hypothetical protein
MLENLVLLTGTVAHVSIKPKTSWVQVSFKMECDGFQAWVEVKGVNQADAAIQMLEALKGQKVIIRGRFASYVMKANPPEYPNETKRYQIAVSKGGIDLAECKAPVNYCMFGGTILEVREAAGVNFVEVGIPYHNPSTDSYGTYLTRVRCPEGVSPVAEDRVVVMGKVVEGDVKGVLVSATQIVGTQKPPTPSSVAADVPSPQEA